MKRIFFLISTFFFVSLSAHASKIDSEVWTGSVYVVGTKNVTSDFFCYFAYGDKNNIYPCKGTWRNGNKLLVYVKLDSVGFEFDCSNIDKTIVDIQGSFTMDNDSHGRRSFDFKNIRATECSANSIKLPPLEVPYDGFNWYSEPNMKLIFNAPVARAPAKGIVKSPSAIEVNVYQVYLKEINTPYWRYYLPRSSAKEYLSVSGDREHVIFNAPNLISLKPDESATLGKLECSRAKARATATASFLGSLTVNDKVVSMKNQASIGCGETLGVRADKKVPVGQHHGTVNVVVTIP